MASAAKETPISGEYQRPDAKAAFEIFNKEIQPKLDKMAEKRGETKEPWDRIKDKCNFPKRTLNYLVKIDDMEDAERDHELLALHEGLKHLKLFMPSDLVTQAQGIPSDASVIPFGEAKKPKLAFQRAAESEEAAGGDEAETDGEGESLETLADEAAEDIIENHPETAAAILADDGMITVTVDGQDVAVHHSDVVPPKKPDDGIIWHDRKTDKLHRYDASEKRFVPYVAAASEAND